MSWEGGGMGDILSGVIQKTHQLDTSLHKITQISEECKNAKEKRKHKKTQHFLTH